MSRVGIKRDDEEKRKFIYKDSSVIIDDKPQYEIAYLDSDESGYIACSDIENEDSYSDTQKSIDQLEYRVLDFHHTSDGALEEILNRYGAEGWDMCGFNMYRNNISNSDLRVLSVFKRKN